MSNSPANTPSFTPRQGLIVEEIDGECLVLDMERNVYFGLDPLGLYIWRGLEQRLATAEILEGLVLHYGEDTRARIEEDMSAFLKRLADAGLVLTDASE